MDAARPFALAAAFAAGVVTAAPAARAPMVAIGLAAIALVVAGWRRTVACLLLAATALGCALGSMRLASVDDARLAQGARRSADALLEGEVLSDPAIAGGASRFLLGVRRAEIDGDPFRVRERAWVSIRPPPAARMTVGTLVRVDARLRPVLLADMDAAGRASAARLRRRGVAARAFAPADAVQVLGSVDNPVARIAESGRAAVRRAARHLPERQRGLLLGVTIGDVSRLDADVDLDFRTTGLSHLVAVSGANVAMVLGVVALLLRLVGAPRSTTVGILAVVVLAFMAVTRFEPSVLRAGAMAGVALAGVAIGARRAALTTLGVATLGLLVYDPFLVYSVGFQLSVLATVGILVVAPKIAEALPEGRLSAVAAVTLGAQLAVAPLIVLHFRQLSIIAIAANLVVAPAVAPATILGMIAAALGAIWDPLGRAAMAAGPFIAWMQWIARVLAELPLASVATPGGVLGIAAAAALTALALATAKGHRPARWAPFVCGLALLVTAGTWARALGPPPLGGLVVTMIDVGQGEAILVRAHGRTMLIDGGPEEPLLLRGLRAQGVRRIDLLVMTHPHEDHIAGLVPIAERFPVARALDPYIEDDLPSYRRFTDALDRRRIPRDRAVAGMTYRLGPALVEVLWPPPTHMEGTPADINNNSIVMRVRYGSDAILFAGETQEEAQQALLERPHHRLAGDVLKVSHHGSRRMIPEFYAATRARIALIPVGTNTFGHPAAETLIALDGMRVLRSDHHGTVTVALDGRGGATVRTERNRAGRAA